MNRLINQFMRRLIMRRLKVFFVDKTAMVFDNIQNVQKKDSGFIQFTVDKGNDRIISVSISPYNYTLIEDEKMEDESKLVIIPK